jgi:hypothetical protein
MEMGFKVALIGLMSVAVSCSELKKEKQLEETSDGRNTLSFELDGVAVKQLEDGGGTIIDYGGKLFSATKWSYAAFDIEKETGTVMVRAILDSKDYHELRFCFPEDDLRQGVCSQLEASFVYAILPEIRKSYEVEPGWNRTETIREAEYGYATISDASLSIRTWTTNKNGVPILAGNFSFSGHLTDSLGNVVHFQAKKGVFDITDDPYRPRKEHAGGKWGRFE